MIDIIAPVTVAGLMVALTHAPLGMEVLRRGIIFIDLAVAQIAGLGLVAAEVLLPELSPWLGQLTALVCAIMAGLFFRRVEQSMPAQQEAIIGVSFVLAASLAILLLAEHPHGGDQIIHLLSGQMLFITWSDIFAHAPIYAFILIAWFIKPGWRNGIGFYMLFSLAITSSVQLVGVYVVFASLILPALVALRSKHPYKTAWLCGAGAIIAGITAAIFYDAPAGPVIVVSYVLTALVLYRICKVLPVYQ